MNNKFTSNRSTVQVCAHENLAKAKASIIGEGSGCLFTSFKPWIPPNISLKTETTIGDEKEVTG